MSFYLVKYKQLLVLPILVVQTLFLNTYERVLFTPIDSTCSETCYIKSYSLDVLSR